MKKRLIKTVLFIPIDMLIWFVPWFFKGKNNLYKNRKDLFDKFMDL